MSDVTFTPEERAYLDTGDAAKLPDAPEAKADATEPDIDFGTEPAKEPEKQDEKQKVVPHQALHAERIKRQEVERQLQEQRQMYARFEQRMQEINQAIQPKEQVPDPVQDPIAALQYTQKELEQFKKQQQQEAAQRQHQEQERAVIQQIDHSFISAVRSREAADPSFSEDLAIVNGSLANYIANAYGVTDPAQLNEAVAQEQRRIAYRALQQGLDPADIIKTQADALRDQFRRALGMQQQPQQDATKVLADKQKGLDASRSLSNARGGSSDGSYTPQRIAEMSSEDWGAFKEKLSTSKYNKLMGAV